MVESDLQEPSLIGAIFRWLSMLPAAVIGYIVAYTGFSGYQRGLLAWLQH